MKNKKAKIILISVAAALLLAVPITCISVGSSAAKKVMTTSSEKTNENSDKFLSEVKFDADSFSQKWGSCIENITYPSSNGNYIPISYICTEFREYSKPTIILIHPYGYTYTMMYPIADMLLEEGYNVVMYNQRSHGENTADTITFGLKETEDLYTVIDYINFSPDVPSIGLYGQGTGASTVANYISEKGSAAYIDFAILEDPYSNASDNIDAVLQDRNGIIPEKIFSSLAKSSIKSKYDFSYDSLDIKDKISSTPIPTLVINQQNCPECSYKTSNDVYCAIKNNDKKLVTFSESGFLKAFYDENDKYKTNVLEFISDHIK